MITQAQTIAKLLLDINAVQIQPSSPFTLSSGLLSPIYCDNRRLISFPKQRQQVIDAFVELISQHTLLPQIIAGTATAGIPHAAWLAQQLELPMLYVRDKRKAHGKNNQIEGVFASNQSVILIEDLVTTGGSALSACDALQTAGLTILACCSIFNYGFQQAADAFTTQQIPLYSLCNFNQLLATARQEQTISANEQATLLDWQQNPQQWQPA